MTLTLIQKFVPDHHPIRSALRLTPRYLTIHTTGNEKPGADAEMHAAYLLTAEAIDREVLWHATVDDHQVIQHLPWDEVGWHAADGLTGPGNRTSIGIELCVNSDGDFAQTQRNAAELCAKLIREMPSLLPFPDCIVQHNKWSGKDCPHQIRATPGGWEAFLAMVKAQLYKPVPVEICIGLGPWRKAVKTLTGEHRMDGQVWLAVKDAAVPVRTFFEGLGAEVTWLDADAGGPKAQVTFRLW